MKRWIGPFGALGLALAALAVSVDIAGASHAAPHPVGADPAGGRAPGHAPSAHARAPASTPTNPFDSALRSYVGGRHDLVDAAVLDLRTKTMYEFHPGRREETASIVKADILETLLHEAQDQKRTLSAAEQGTAAGMIEASDNDDATDLFDEEGGAGALAAYDKSAGMTNTTPNSAWGLTETTAPDQIKLLEQLVKPHGLLTTASQQYQLGLMSHIDPGEGWGVSGGIPSGVQVALKNGWLPLDSTDGDPDDAPDWQVNSIGRVRGDGRWYLIAVMTTGNATEDYGIDTIEHISSVVWRSLG